MDGSVADLVCALLSRRAALPRWIRAISQDRNRGRCDHDPILVEFVKKFMCGVNKANAERRQTAGVLVRSQTNKV